MPNVGGGVFGIIVLIVMIFALVKTLQSSVDTGTKLLWVVLIILLPLIGSILWFFMGPGGRNG